MSATARSFLAAEKRGIYTFTTRRRWALRLGLDDLGCKILPESITAAWYAADCPPKLDYRSAGIPLRDRILHRVSKLLRGM